MATRFATISGWQSDGVPLAAGDYAVVVPEGYTGTEGVFPYKVGTSPPRIFTQLAYTGTAFFTLPVADTSAGGLTNAELRASPVPVSGTVTATGPLTDAQLRATPVPVSGTVSTGGLTDAELRASPVPVSGTVTATGPLTDAELRAVPVPVSGTVSTGGLTNAELRAAPVDVNTGLIQPTTPADTQPVSIAAPVAVTGPLTDAQLRASAVPISAAALPLPTGAATEATVATLLKPADTLSAVTSITNPVTAEQATAANLNATVVGTGAFVTQVSSITPPTLTKGTQGSTGFSVQPLSDAGRVMTSLYTDGAQTAGATTVETAITLTLSSGTAATSTGTSFVITSGKTFRIQQIILESRGSTTATAQTTKWSLRVNTAGAVTTASTPVLINTRTSNGPTSNQVDRQVMTFPGGFDITGDGTLQFGLTASAAYTTNAPSWYANIIGQEF